METRAAAEKWITEIFTKSLDEATTFELMRLLNDCLRGQERCRQQEEAWKSDDYSARENARRELEKFQVVEGMLIAEAIRRDQEAKA